MDEQFLSNVDTDYSGDDPMAAIEHAELKKLIVRKNSMTAKLFNDHKVALDTRGAPLTRMNLLVEYLFGTDTIERFRFEQAWQNLLIHSIEVATEQAIEVRGSRELHIPGQGIHLVKGSSNDNTNKADTTGEAGTAEVGQGDSPPAGPGDTDSDSPGN